jgi:hypothetical protein
MGREGGIAFYLSGEEAGGTFFDQNTDGTSNCIKFGELYISWTDHVRNEEVLFRVKEQRNIPHEIRKRKAN